MAQEPPLYDLILLLDTQADDERRSQLLDNVQAAIEKGGEVVGRHDWGVRPTVYEVQKRPTRTTTCSSSTGTTRCSSSSTTR